MLVEKLRAYLRDDGTMQQFAWPGGYPIYYIVQDCGTLCPKCASSPEAQNATADDSQWYLIDAQCNYETADLFCDNCGEHIPAAYLDNIGAQEIPEPINLDCMVDAGELDTIADDISKPEVLRRYAREKAQAMRARLAGSIADALELERNCETIYKQLPKAWQW